MSIWDKYDPILFAIFISSLRPYYDKCKYIKYADDLTVVNSIRESGDDELASEFEHILSWCSENNMKVNVYKTAIMDINTKSNITLSTLDNVEVVKFACVLGVWLDVNLSWDLHVHKTVSKASKCVFFIVQLRRAGVQKHILWNVYFSLVRSILTYAFPAVCNMSHKSFNILSSIERRVTKIIGIKAPVDLSSFCESMCISLAHNVLLYPSHPLRTLLTVICESTRTLRHNSQSKKMAVAKTCRLHNSFIRFLR